jgi:hypothetical protein
VISSHTRTHLHTHLYIHTFNVSTFTFFRVGKSRCVCASAFVDADSREVVSHSIT